MPSDSFRTVLFLNTESSDPNIVQKNIKSIYDIYRLLQNMFEEIPVVVSGEHYTLFHSTREDNTNISAFLYSDDVEKCQIYLGSIVIAKIGLHHNLESLSGKDIYLLSSHGLHTVNPEGDIVPFLFFGSKDIKGKPDFKKVLDQFNKHVDLIASNLDSEE